MKQLLFVILTAITLLACDSKKTSIAGTVVNTATGEAVPNVLVSYLQCKENGDNCTEIIIAQCTLYLMAHLNLIKNAPANLKQDG